MRRKVSTPAWLADTQRHLPLPDLTILLDIAPATASRARRRAATGSSATWPCSARVRESYRRQAEAHGWVRLDGERGKEDLARDILEVVTGRLAMK